MIEIDDSGCPDAIREYVRSNTHIELLGYIKRGCIGEVYFAKRKKLGDEIVLKFYLSKAGYDSSEEAVILKAIDHPNILKIYDLQFVPPEYAVFLSPRICGGDLQEHIDNNIFSSGESLKIVSQILNGITDLHATHHLVHRDLKPGNILYDIKKKNAIIADLGAVKKIDDLKGYVSGSKATRVYLPPECIIDDEYYYQSDLYQVGLIMFQLLKGFFPINNHLEWLSKKENIEISAIKNSIQREVKFYEKIDEKICKGKIAETSRLPIYLDSSFKRVINKAIHLDYKKRFQSSSEFIKAVHELGRSCPDYLAMPDFLLVRHSSGKEFKIYRNKNRELIIEKKLNGRDWRKDNGHNGDINSILDLARKK